MSQSMTLIIADDKIQRSLSLSHTSCCPLHGSCVRAEINEEQEKGRALRRSQGEIVRARRRQNSGFPFPFLPDVLTFIFIIIRWRWTFLRQVLRFPEWLNNPHVCFDFRMGIQVWSSWAQACTLHSDLHVLKEAQDFWHQRSGFTSCTPPVWLRFSY